MRCRDVMKTDVARCLETLSVQACAEMMRDNGIGFVPVLDADRPWPTTFPAAAGSTSSSRTS